MNRLRALLLTGSATLALVGSVVMTSAAPGAAGATSCAPATDIEAIVDDSGSMSFTDENKLRVQGMDLLIDTLPAKTYLGAVEFGSGYGETPPADTIFPPEPVGPNAAAMSTALSTVINADNGATDYNGAFAKGDADNPGSNARIFLTDGGHDEGEYLEAHLAHNVPTYVVGFGVGLGEATDVARLQKIAADTGGQLFQLEEAAQLQPVMNNIGAALTCQTPPRTFTDELAQGKSKTHGITVGASTKTLQIALTWGSPVDKFKISHLKLIVNHKVVAAGRPQPVAKLKVKRSVSSTFALLTISHLRKGTLSFAVEAATVGSSSDGVKVTTQVGKKGRVG